MKEDEIKVVDLSVQYDLKPALWNTNFSIPRGVCTGIIGPNGAGKSTLIKAMLGATKADSGEISFFGKSIEEMMGSFAYVGQRSDIDWDFPITVSEVVLMGVYGKLGLFKRPSKQDYELAMHILKKLGMTDYANRQLGELSGGQQQRVFIARALMQDADVIFMDEPFNNIDMATEELIVEILHELLEKKKSIFVVHHDLSTVSKYFNWLILLHTRLVGYGPTKEVYTKEMLAETFDGKSLLFEEVLKRKGEKAEGLA